MKKQVFLGGACGHTTWRRDIAIPALEAAAITYFDPQLGPGEWTEARESIEMQAKAQADVLIFVINSETRGVAAIAEVAYYLANGRALALVVSDVRPTIKIGGHTPTQSECDDLNRGRIFVRTMAKLHTVPVFAEVEAAAHHAIQLIQAEHASLTQERLRSILADLALQDTNFLITELDPGFLIQISAEERDAHSGVSRLFSGRQWFIERNASTSEVVRTAFKALLTWQEHELRHRFAYRGEHPFSPHHDIEALVRLAKARRSG